MQNKTYIRVLYTRSDSLSQVMAKRKPVVFTAKHRKELAVQLGARDYADVVESALAVLKRGVHLQMYPSRHKFVNIVCSENVKPAST